MDIDELTVHAAKLLDLTDNGWERSIYFDLSKLTEECGEVAECLNKSKFSDEDLADELSDVITVVAIIALKKNINLEKALLRKQGLQIQKLIARFNGGKGLSN
jgi:NTP pyrophosphatase (non-canonical NTP hydrolase)